MIVALHGFLGQASDWDYFRRDWSVLGSGEIFTPSLFSPAALATWAPSPGVSLADWAERFANELDRQRGGQSLLLVGYSLGGRLALHLLLARPDMFDRAVIISASSGMESEDAKLLRRESDELWARRFENEKWESVLKDWNAQPVFREGTPLTRIEKEYDRKALGTALREWSLGRQELLRPRLAKLKTPILWMSGEKDTAYVRQGELAAQHLPGVLFRKVPGAGHRLPWDSPQLFGKDVKDFLEM